MLAEKTAGDNAGKQLLHIWLPALLYLEQGNNPEGQLYQDREQGYAHKKNDGHKLEVPDRRRSDTVSVARILLRVIIHFRLRSLWQLHPVQALSLLAVGRLDPVFAGADVQQERKFSACSTTLEMLSRYYFFL